MIYGKSGGGLPLQSRARDSIRQKSLAKKGSRKYLSYYPMGFDVIYVNVYMIN